MNTVVLIVLLIILLWIVMLFTVSVGQKLHSEGDQKFDRSELTNSFLSCQANMASLINLALFKLSEEGNLSGYIDIIEKLNSIIYKEFKDQNVINEWINKFKESGK